MPKKSLGAEQIVTKLRQVVALRSQDKSVAAAFKEVGLGATEPERNWGKRCCRQHSMSSATSPSTVRIRSGTLPHAAWTNQSTATTIIK